MRRRVAVLACLASVLAVPRAQAADALRLELHLPEPHTLQHGVVVGDLVLANRSGDELILDLPAGLEYRIAGPGGATRTVRDRRGPEPELNYVVALAPGGRIIRPICLLARTGRFLFDRVGTYAITAHYRLAGSGAALVSEAVTVTVAPAGDGLALWRELVGEPDIAVAFAGISGLEGARQRLHRFLDYRHEVVKLMLYQYEGPALRTVLQGTRATSGSDEVTAEILQAMARTVGFGTGMWGWIRDALRQPGRSSPRPEARVVIRSGYIL